MRRGRLHHGMILDPKELASSIAFICNHRTNEEHMATPAHHVFDIPPVQEPQDDDHARLQMHELRGLCDCPMVSDHTPIEEPNQ